MLKKSLFILVCLLLSLAPIVVSGQDNSKYHKIAEIGRPAIEAIDWNPKQDLIAAATAHDIWLYDTQLKDVAHLDLAAATDLIQWPSKDNIQPVKLWRIQEVKWSPDGHWLIIRIAILTVDGIWQPDIWQIWSWNGTEFTQVMPDRFQFVSKITWNADTNQYAVLTANKVYRFAAADNTLLSTNDATDFSWNNAGTSIALLKSASIELVDTQTQRQLVSFSTDESGFSGALWSPDDSKIGAENNNRLFVWDVKTGRQLSMFLSEVPDGLQYGYSNPILLSKHIRHMHPHFQTPRPQKMLREAIIVWLWLPDSEQVVLSLQNPNSNYWGYLAVYETEKGSVIYKSAENSFKMTELTLLPQANRLITTEYGSSGYPNTGVWNTKTWEPLKQDFADLSWTQSPDAQQLASYDLNFPGIRISDTDALHEQFSLNPTIDRIRAITWQSTNQQIAVASTNELQIWNLTTRQMVADNLMHNGFYSTMIGWSSSGKQFAVLSAGPYFRFGYNCPSVHLWDAVTWLPTRALYGKTGIISGAVWGSNTDQLLMQKTAESNCGSPPAISIWNPDQGETLSIKNNWGVINQNWAQEDTTFSVLDRSSWYLFDANTGSILNTVALPQNTQRVEWMPKDNLLIASVYKSIDAQHHSYTLNFLDAATGEVLLSIPDVQGFGLAHNQTNIAIDYLSGDLEIGSIRRDKNNVIYEPMRTTTSPKVTFWDIQWNQQDTAVELLGLTKTVANEINNQVLQIWDLGTLMPETLFNQPYLLSEAISGFAWHPGGKTFAISRGGGIVEIWSSEN